MLWFTAVCIHSYDDVPIATYRLSDGRQVLDMAMLTTWLIGRPANLIDVFPPRDFAGWIKYGNLEAIEFTDISDQGMRFYGIVISEWVKLAESLHECQTAIRLGAFRVSDFHKAAIDKCVFAVKTAQEINEAIAGFRKITLQ